MSDEGAAPPPRRKSTKAARNERRKAAAATINAVSVATLVALILQPVATGRHPAIGVVALSIGAFFALQAITHYILDRLED